MSTKAEEQLQCYDYYLCINISYKEAIEGTNKYRLYKAKMPIWRFIEKFLWIKTKNGGVQKFILNQEQIDLYKEIYKQQQLGNPIRVNILKARQIGFSTFIAALYFCLTIFSPGKTALIIADKADHATNLFRKYKLFYARLPEEIKLPQLKSNAKELIVDYGDGVTSEIKIVVAGDDAGRSDTAQYIHASECAFWKDLKDTLASVNQTVSATNKDSAIILETTANGYNEYKDHWDNDVVGKSNYKALFYPWWGNEAYVDEYKHFELTEHEKKIQKLYNLSLEQIAWYRNVYYSVASDFDKLLQEYPSSPTEAFRSTGNCLFDLDLIGQRKDELMDYHLGIKKFKKGRFVYEKQVTLDGSRIVLKDRKFIESENGKWTIYKDVDPTHPYVINCDPAMGGEDYYAIQVIDNYTLEQVARFYSQKVYDDEIAYQLCCAGWYWNNALICTETNTTSYILQTCERCGYDFIYQDKDYETLSDRYIDKFGYKVKQSNRNAMLAMFKEAFRENYRMINDYETLCEMESFQIIKTTQMQKEKAQAISGKHDDLVMAMAGIFLIRDEQSYFPRQTTRNPEKEENFFTYAREVTRKNREKNKKGVFMRW